LNQTSIGNVNLSVSLVLLTTMATNGCGSGT